MRHWNRAAAVTAVAAAVLGLTPGPAGAEPGAGLLVSVVQATPGGLRFVLTGPDLPDPATLAAGKVTVSAGGTDLPVKVSDASAAPRTDLPVRGVVLVLDVGATMVGAPLAAAEVAAFSLVDTLPPDVAVGLVAFGTTATTVLAPGYDRASLRTAVGALTAAGGSALYDGVRQAAGLLGASFAERRLVVVTDGPDIGSQATAADASAALLSGHIPLDLVTFGTAAAQPAVTGLATGSGGQAHTAATGPALTTALHGLADRMATPVSVTATVPAALSGRSGDVQISVVAGGQNLSATTQVTFAVDPTVAPALTLVRPRFLPAVFFYGALACIGLGFIIAGFVGMYLVLGRTAVRRRLRQLDNFGSRATPAETVRTEQEGSVVVRTALALSERAVQRQGRTGIEVALDRAGIALRPAEWMLVRAAAAGAGAVLLSLMLPVLFGVPIGAVGGWLFTAWYRKSRSAKRARKFGDLLPDALQLVVGALRSGFSLMQSIDAVAREGPEPVAGEFGRAMAEIRLGGEIEAALERAAERNTSRDLAWLVMAIRIQREVGGNLSEVMETAVETMRERGRLGRHVRALSAEGRLSAYVLIGMPLVLTAWLVFFRGDYIRPLYTQPIGLLMLGAAVFMVALGAFWISRLVKVEV